VDSYFLIARYSRRGQLYDTDICMCRYAKALYADSQWCDLSERLGEEFQEFVIDLRTGI
jgi:hypothetical protein